MHSIRNVQAGYTEADFWTKWKSVNPRMTLCIKITPKADWTDGAAVGFTSNTRNMTLPGHPGITFRSSPGITPTVVEQVLGQAGSLEMTGIYQTDSFTRADVIAGKWNFAEVEVFSVCWDNTDLGELVHHKGNLGQLKDYQTHFTAEGRGIIARLSNDVNIVTQKPCRVKEFRDAECGHTASTVTIDETAYNITQEDLPAADTAAPDFPALIFSDADFVGNIPPEDFYANGKALCTSGANSGISREIVHNLYSSLDNLVTVTLKRSFPFEVATGDTITLTAGCVRTLEDCRKYGNAVNFRGEAFVPGIEAANRIPPGN